MQGETNTRRLKVPNRPGIYTRTRIGVNGKPELVYEYEYRDADKRQHFASAEGGVMAAVSAREAKRSEVRAEKTERKLGAPARATSMPPFGDRARKYLLRKEATVADSTYEEYEREVRLHLLPLWEHKPMSAVTTDAVLELLVKLKRDGYSEHKRASILARLGGIFRQTLADPACRGLPIVNPVDGLEQSERPKPTTRDNIVTLNPTEVAALIAAAPVRYRAAVAILPYAGLRIAEAMGLLIEDVDFAKNRIHVRHQRARKGTGIIDRTKTSAGTREVAMTPELAALIRHHIDKYAWTKEPTAPLFQTRNGTPLSIRNFRRSGFTKAIEKAGLKMRVHDLRCTFGSMLFVAFGDDRKLIADQMGHKDARTTEKFYARVVDKDKKLREASDRLSAAFSVEPIKMPEPEPQTGEVIELASRRKAS